MEYLLGTTLLLASALLFSLYRLLIKATGNRLIFMAGLNAVSVAIGLVGIWFVPMLPKETVPFLIAASVSYSLAMVCLIRAFEFGDLGVVEPFKAGIRVMTIALLSIWLLDESAQIVHWFAVGALLLAFLIQAGWNRRPGDSPRSSLLLAMAAGVASGLQYSFDAMGMRSVPSPSTYIVWNLFLGLPIIVYVVFAYRKESVHVVASQFGRIALGSSLDIVGYALILFVIYFIAVIDILPLLNLHVLLVTLLGWLVLKERMGWQKAISSGLILVSALMVGFLAQ